MKQRYKHTPINEWEQWDYEEWFHDREQSMNPTPEQLQRFAVQFYEAGFLDLEPISLDDGRFWVALHDDCGNEIDEVTFTDEATARRFVDWLITNAEELQTIEQRTFAL